MSGRRAVRAGLLVLGVALIALCARLLLGDLSADRSLRELKEQVEASEATASLDAPDGEAWVNPDTAGWLEVGGTDVSYPVTLSSGDEDPDFYLTHDYWKRRNWRGNPYLDVRGGAEGAHLMVYGHKLGLTGGMFSSLRDRYQQASFDRLGALKWTPVGGETETYVPVFAMKVDKGYSPIQRFEFEDEGELASWLLAVGADASARADGWRETCERAERVITLVTCAQLRGGQRDRTVTVFARTADAVG